MTMATKKRVLVIGAGVSGLTAIKSCKEENLNVVCYEKTGEFGGLWRYHDNDLDGLPSVMKSTISNTSKEMSSFSDFPPSAEFPTYMHHSTVLKYIEMYADHFDLLGHITYYQEVVEVIPEEDYGATGKWLAKVRDIPSNEYREETFDGVMACVGHHAYPFTPSYPNIDLFHGKIMHSHGYKSYTGMEEQTILVIGAGNSGSDIATEMANVSKKIFGRENLHKLCLSDRIFLDGTHLHVLGYRFHQLYTIHGTSGIISIMSMRGQIITSKDSTLSLTKELVTHIKVYLSTRRGTWIFPRLFDKGKPMDVCLIRRYKTLLPTKYSINKIEKTLNKRMDHKRFGIKPYHPATSQHPTINDELQAKLLTGRIIIKRDVKEFTESGVIFDSEEETTPIDVVIFATGFQVKFPFLSDDILRVGKNNKVFLYKNVFPPQLKHHTLGVIGLIQPSGSLFPVFEMQSRWFVALMTGKCHLPPNETMLADVRKTEGFRARNYVQSARHSVESPWLDYMDELAGCFGAKPNMAALLIKDPKLFSACFFGPCLPYQYRLTGPHKWEGARDAVMSYKERMYEHLKNGREK